MQPTVDGRRLVEQAGSSPTGIEVQVVDHRLAASFARGLDDLLLLAATIELCLAERTTSGIVVTHGTDTMEEAAYGLDLLLDDPRPVVFTGAQRAADAQGADGPSNLRAALTVAADPGTRHDCVLVCFDGEVHAARGVAKCHTTALSAFRSSAPLHHVLDDTVRRLGRRDRRPVLPRPVGPVPRVEVVTCHLGADGMQVRSAVAHGADGIVLGQGNAGPDVVDAVADAVDAGVVVLVTSRVAEGPALPRYAAGGGASPEEVPTSPTSSVRGRRGCCSAWPLPRGQLTPDRYSRHTYSR